jgi:transmembrane 9 superfamily member 2/4
MTACRSNRGGWTLWLALVAGACSTARAFYVPGVQPVTFQEGDEVPLKVNALTSIHTQIPRDYYRLPFCQPEDGPRMASESLGEFLTGNKIQSSPYTEIKMKKDLYCQVVCDVTLDKLQAAKLRLHIKYGYNHNWIVDNLPSAAIGMHIKNPKATTGRSKRNRDKKGKENDGTKGSGKKKANEPDEATAEKIRKRMNNMPKAPKRRRLNENDNTAVAATPMTRYAGGFPMGFMNPDDKVPYIYNHVNINLDYHPVLASSLPSSKTGDASPNTITGYRVVGFAVEPFSIRHEYGDDGKTLKTCPGKRTHMSRGVIQSSQGVAIKDTVIYTYDVIWKESPVEWSSRWDIYLSEDHLVPAQVHWYSITNSILIVVFLSLLVISVLVRNLRRDIDAYNALAALADDDEGGDDGPGSDETGWKLVHADVFRPPSTHPMLYCVFCGSGAQLGVTIMMAIVLSAVGFLNPSRRGSLMTAFLVFYMLCGVIAGYVSARLFKAFRGRQWQLCTVITAILVPGLAFGMFLFFNIILAFLGSSGSAPFLDVLIVLVMWCGISIPLVFLGAYFGYKAEAIEFPTVTSTIARAIPEPPLLLNPMVGMCCTGIIPFAAAYVELFFIMTSLWMDRFYYVFGFTLIVYIILIVTCAEVTLLLVYYQLCAENHRWWWYSFFCAGSTAAYTFVYSIFWFRTLEASRLVMTYLLYFGYMLLICFSMLLVFGTVGALASLWFVRHMFSTIKVD